METGETHSNDNDDYEWLCIAESGGKKANHIYY